MGPEYWPWALAEAAWWLQGLVTAVWQSMPRNFNPAQSHKSILGKGRAPVVWALATKGPLQSCTTKRGCRRLLVPSQQATRTAGFSWAVQLVAGLRPVNTPLEIPACWPPTAHVHHNTTFLLPAGPTPARLLDYTQEKNPLASISGARPRV